MDKNVTFFLTDREYDLAAKVIQSKGSGTYRLRDIFGLHWLSIWNPTDFGRRFKRAVRAGLFPNLRMGPRTAENHQLYVLA